MLRNFVYAADQWTTAGGPDPGPANFADVEVVIRNILMVIFPLFGIVAFFMLVFGGFRLLFSGGNPESIKKAWGQITWAIVGIILLIAVWLIFKFVEEFTGVPVTQFEIPK